MSKLITKITVPIILVGFFTIAIFIALNYEQLNSSFYIVFLLLVIFIFFFGLAVGQNFSSPIKKLLDRAKELSNGDISSQVFLETKDELSELASTFNKIAEELKISQEQERDMDKSVDIKVRAKTQVLEETIDALEQKVRNRTIEAERLVKRVNELEEELKSKKQDARAS
ncbi:MAG: HAMP domain-containing protein [Candidatus Staskawiczbacteria bacterium]|nr:HAMP domain-containing protein [Candidatus Staskawiczbacteria bacterium]